MDIVLATGNVGKVRELQAMLAGTPYKVIPQGEFACPPVAETGLSFVENALIKARHAATFARLPAIADDSGLACDALQGAPGIFSARYARSENSGPENDGSADNGPAASDADNVAKLLAAIQAVPCAARGCRFICVMVYVAHAADPCPVIAQGVWEGRVAIAPRGEHGFGYDSIFEVPDTGLETGLTAAELAPARKQAISHRGLALTELVRQLTSRHPGR